MKFYMSIKLMPIETYCGKKIIENLYCRIISEKCQKIFKPVEYSYEGIPGKLA